MSTRLLSAALSSVLTSVALNGAGPDPAADAAVGALLATSRGRPVVPAPTLAIRIRKESCQTSLGSNEQDVLEPSAHAGADTSSQK